MKQTTRIKVSDLLLNVWRIDTVTFSWLMIGDIVWLDTRWISWKLLLQSIDNSTIIATLEDVVCYIHEESDVSGTPYIRNVRIPSFWAYFVIDPAAQVYNEEDDSPVFAIDIKNATIDVQEMLYQSILLDTPFVKRTPEEQAVYALADPDDLDSFDGDSWWQVIFRNAK